MSHQLRSVAAALLLSTACRDSAGGASSLQDFGDDFLFGASIAGFQVDPGCPSLDAAICEDRHSDWYQWVTDPELIAQPGNHLSGQPLSDGPGHRELYDADFRLAGDTLGLGAMRVSIEW